MIFNIFRKHSKKTGLALAVAIAMPLTAQHEGLRLKAYLDFVGIPTICYGETENVSIGDVKSKKECDDMLAVRLAYFGQMVDYLVKPELNACEHASLSSMSYNIGLPNFKNSTLLKKLNSNDKRGAALEFEKWVYAKGVKLNGLVKRRKAERKLFESDCNQVQGAERALSLEGLNVHS